MATIGSASRRAGVPVETIRYYERAGFLPPPPRDAGGRRVYREDDIRRLAFVRRCRELDFPLREVRTLLGLDGGECGEVRRISEHHRAAIRSRIRELRRLEAALDELTAGCGDDAGQCPALRRLSAEPPPT